MKFHLGQKVICVNNYGAEELTEGKIYTVENYQYTNGEVTGIDLEEVKARPRPKDIRIPWFHAARFKPIPEQPEKKKTAKEIADILNGELKFREDNPGCESRFEISNDSLRTIILALRHLAMLTKIITR